jgi:hypothetical protein
MCPSEEQIAHGKIKDQIAQLEAAARKIAQKELKEKNGEALNALQTKRSAILESIKRLKGKPSDRRGIIAVPRIRLPNVDGRAGAAISTAAPVLFPLIVEEGCYRLNEMTATRGDDDLVAQGFLDRTIGSSPLHMLDNFNRMLGGDKNYFHNKAKGTFFDIFD